MCFEINLVIALSDKKNLVYIEEIKKRRYTKEFHAFIKSCVSIRLESRYKKQGVRFKSLIFIIRCSSDELQTHSFFKYQKKLNHNQQLVNNDIIKLLQIYKKKEPTAPDIQNITETFSKHRYIIIHQIKTFFSR
jgi:hypothetical protein